MDEQIIIVAMHPRAEPFQSLAHLFHLGFQPHDCAARAGKSSCKSTDQRQSWDEKVVHANFRAQSSWRS
jgi:hypothetical protein